MNTALGTSGITYTERTQPHSDSSGATHLVRGIRRWDLVALVLNAIIGAGIFGLPSQVFAQAGSWSLLAYLVCAMLVVLLVLCFAEVSSRFSATGGPYVYALHAFGPAAAFQMGWLLWIARFTAFAALCNMWLTYLGFFRPEVQAGAWRTLTIILVVTALTAINILGVRSSSLFNNIFTVGKVLPLLVFGLVGIFFVAPENFSFGDFDFDPFSKATLTLAFVFSGFEMAVIPAGETRDPRKHTPFALLVGVSIVAFIYIFAQVVSIGTLPELAESSRPLADAAGRFMGPAGALLVATGAVISVTGTLNTIVLVGPRLLFAMAEQRQLPSVFAATHPRYKTPYVAILASAALMLVLTLQGDFITALTISTVIRLVVYAATCVSLIVLRHNPNAPPAAFRTPMGNIVAVVAVVMSSWLIASSKWSDIRTTLYVAAIGVVLYLLFNKKIARIAAMIFFPITLASCSSGYEETLPPPVESTFTVRDSAGITIVESEKPKWTNEEWTVSAEPFLTIGAVDGPDSTQQLTGITGVTRLSDGRIAIALQGTSEIRFFDSTGRYVKSAGRRGRGPGEFSSLSYMTRFRGDSLLAYDNSRNAITFFDGNGEYVNSASISLSREIPATPQGVFHDGTMLAVMYSEGRNEAPADSTKPKETYARLLVVSTSGGLAHDLGKKVIGRRNTEYGTTPQKSSSPLAGMTITKMFALFPNVYIAARDSTFYYADASRYEILAHTTAGQLRRIIRVTLPPVPVPASEKHDTMTVPIQISSGDATQTKLLKPEEVVWADFYPAFTRLLPDYSGNLWVQKRSKPNSTTLQQPWHVFDPAGTWLGELNLPAIFRIIEIGDDYVLGMAKDSLDVESVRLYSLKKRRPE